MVNTGDDSPPGVPIGLGKEPPPAAGPAWIVVPARVVALIVVLPLRLVHDLVVMTARGVRALWGGLTRLPGRLGRLVGAMLRGIGLALYRWLLAPAGRLLGFLVVRPLRWFAVVVVLGVLRRFGRGTGRLARRLHRLLIAPAGRLLGRLAEFLLLRPLGALGRGLRLLLSMTGRAFGLLIGVPAVLVWRYVLRPPLLVLGALTAGAVWSWRLAGRFLGWLVHVLIAVPARAAWRYLLSPAVAGARGTWRLAARLLRTFVVVPVRVVVVAPARWVGTSVLRPVWHGVREPVRAARRVLRDARRDVRLQLRRAFRGH